MATPAAQVQNHSASPAGALSAAAYGGMLACGIMCALLGAILPALSGRLSFSLADIGTLFLVMNFSMLVASLALGVVMDRFGMKAPLALGPISVAVALVLMAQASRFSMLFPAAILLGLGGGALNGSTNTLIVDLHEDDRRKAASLNLLGVFYGVGALFLPITMGILLARVGVNGLLNATAVLCAVAGCFAAVLRFPAPKQPAKLPVAEMRRFLRVPIVWTMAILLAFESGNEFVVGGYFTTFLTRVLGVEVQSASNALACYWVALMAARVLLSRLLLRFNAHAVLLVCAALSAVGTAMVGLAGGVPLAVAGMALCGLALAGIFPTVLGVAGAEFPTHSGTVFGILFGVALVGGMLMPWFSGLLAQQWGVRSVFALATFNFVAVLVMNALTWHLRSQAAK